jgi:hypothetical protein
LIIEIYFLYQAKIIKYMAKEKRVPHQITIDGQKYMEMLPDVYGDIGTVVGITKAPSPDNTNYAGKLRVSDAILAGDLVRIKCLLENRKYRSILCVTAKLAGAMGGLLSKKVAGQDVRTAMIPRRQRLG